MASVAFFFNSDFDFQKYSYGHYYKKEFSRSIRPFIGKMVSKVFYGDLLLLQHTSKPNGIFKNKNYNGFGSTFSVENSEHSAFVIRFAKSLIRLTNTIDFDKICFNFLNKNIYVIALSNIALSVSKQIDAALNYQIKDQSLYLGCAQIDGENLFHKLLLENSLIQDHAIYKGSTYIDNYPSPKKYYSSFKFQDRKKTYYSDDPDLDKIFSKNQMKFRNLGGNKEDEKFLRTFYTDSHIDSLINSIKTNIKKFPAEFKYHFESEPNLPELIIEESKIRDYILNSNHSTGKNKAYLFEKLLGYTAIDWKKFSMQIKRQIKSNNFQIESVRMEKYGIKYEVRIPITGNSGETKIVRTTWMAETNKPSRLITGMIEDRSIQTKVKKDPEKRNVNLIKDGDWSLLYKIADRSAKKKSTEFIPKPIRVGGEEKDYYAAEGLVGISFIVIKDARSKFCLYLKSKGIGWKNYRSGWALSPTTNYQSHDRNYAYCREFTEILIMNGVECSIISHLD